jgi:hypothetical protein
VITRAPALIALVVNDALPFVTLAVPSEIGEVGEVESTNSSIPFGTPPEDVTVVVKVTD